MIAFPSLHDASLRKTSLCLGLLLGAREVGYGLLSQNDLLRYGVLNIRKIQSQEAKEARFRQIVLRYLDQEGCRQVAVVRPLSGRSGHPLIASMLTWLESESARRGVSLEMVEREQVKLAIVPSVNLPTGRRLAQTLALRFPELQQVVADTVTSALRDETTPSPMPHRLPLPSAKERYWSQMFLAVAAGLCVLNRSPRRDSSSNHLIRPSV